MTIETKNRKVLEFGSYQQACEYVADTIANLIRNRHQEGRGCVLGLATGATPAGVYKCLVKKHREGQTFAHVTSFNLDEYWPMNMINPQSFNTYMRSHFFDEVDMKIQNTYLLPGMEPLENIQQICSAYEDAIETSGGIDTQLLGIGRNGHIAFNEPGTSFQSRTELVDLHEQTRKDAAATFGGLENVPRQGITMGIATIMQARKIILMANGKAKSSVLYQALHGPVTEELPASVLQLHPDVTVVMDKECAAGFLK